MWKLFVNWAARSRIEEIVAQEVEARTEVMRGDKERALRTSLADQRAQIADELRLAGYTAVALAVHDKKEIPAPDKVPLQNWVRHTKRRLPW